MLQTSKDSSYISHISGVGTPPESPKHISGQETEEKPHISGFVTSSKTQR